MSEKTIYQLIYKLIFINIFSIIKIGSILFIVFFLMLIDTKINILKKTIMKLKKNRKKIRRLNENIQRNLNEVDEYDNYMILYFKEDCNYSEGFNNGFRNDISFIINRENNTHLSSTEQLIIHKNIGIEIHFNRTVQNLENFFYKSFDKYGKFSIT